MGRSSIAVRIIPRGWRQWRGLRLDTFRLWFVNDFCNAKFAGVGALDRGRTDCEMHRRRGEQLAGLCSTMRYIRHVVGTTRLGVMLRDPASFLSHQRPRFVYAAVLVVTAGLSLLLPAWHPQQA